MGNICKAKRAGSQRWLQRLPPAGAPLAERLHPVTAFVLGMLVVGLLMVIGGYEPATRHSSPFHVSAAPAGR